MEKWEVDALLEKYPVLQDIRQEKEVVWINPDKTDYAKSMEHAELTTDDIEDAQQRLLRFAPFIMKCFPETKDRGGLIESALTPIPAMQNCINQKYNGRLSGRLLLKQDSRLAIAGSVKARGGIYEVLKHTEDLALEHGILEEGGNYETLAAKDAKAFFSSYTIQVGSTGNLGLSIGIMSAAIGYHVIVQMSSDAKQWK